jgi:hypothetical protein
MARARDFAGEARREVEQSDAAKQWVKKRIELIHNRVTAYDVLARNGIELRFNGTREEQISCPFHGADKKPSCRFYPESVKGSSHMWCFVCQEPGWDCIGLWKKFTNFEGRFTGLLRDIEKSYGITPPEPPAFGGSYEEEAIHDESSDEVRKLFEVCERRLLSAKRCFELRPYLTLGSALDRLAYELNNGARTPTDAIPILRKILDKIGERERSCPDG